MDKVNIKEQSQAPVPYSNLRSKCEFSETFSSVRKGIFCAPFVFPVLIN